MPYKRLLSVKLFFIVFFSLTVLMAGFAWYFLTVEAEQYEELLRQCAQRTSEIVVGSTRQSMLYNRSEDTYEAISSIVEMGPTIQKIDLLNKAGLVAYSTDSSQIGRQTDFREPICSSCHMPEGAIRKDYPGEWYQIHEADGNGRTMSYIRPISNEPSCYTADCHAHAPGDKFLGVLHLNISLATLDQTSAENRQNMLESILLITILVGLIVSIFIWFGVHNPVKKLILGTRKISSGDLDHTIDVDTSDEIGVLARSFNTMTKDLHDAKAEITAWSEQLEERVKEKTEELELTQKRNQQIEKMASLGQLSATVAHELNNPIAGILTYSKLIQKKLQHPEITKEDHDKIMKYLSMIESESSRSGDIVKNMLLFSRQEEVKSKKGDINQTIKEALDLVEHHFKLHNIHVVRLLQDDIPEFMFDANQIKQALLALFVNAVEAMENDGMLTLKSYFRPGSKYVEIKVQDNGKGIPSEIREQVFEPFFTTKNAVKGVGLGLSAVYAIVHRHKGKIKLDSVADQGTTFTILLPVKPPDGEPNEE